jgi:hypothetical protein
MRVADRRLERAQLAYLARIPSGFVRNGNLRWISSAIVFMVAAAATFAVILLFAVTQEPSPSQTQRVVPQNVRLALHVEGQGDRLVLSWDRQNPIVMAAVGAVLRIRDGTTDREIHLDAGQLANGLVSYKPLSDDVNFRLEVQSAERFVSASLRVLDGTKMSSAVPGPMVFKPVLSRASSETARPVSTVKAPAVLTPSNLAGTHERAANQNVRGVPLPQRSSSVMPPAIEASVSMPPPTLPVIVGLNAASAGLRPMPVPEKPHKVAGDNELAKTAGSSAHAPSTTPAIGGDAPKTKGVAATRARSLYAAPEPLIRVMPKVDAAGVAAAFLPAQVQILVRIDKRGRIRTMQVLGKKADAQSALVTASIAAARAWKFKPAALDGKPVESEHVIVFDFRPSSR